MLLFVKLKASPSPCSCYCCFPASGVIIIIIMMMILIRILIIVVFICHYWLRSAQDFQLVLLGCSKHSIDSKSRGYSAGGGGWLWLWISIVVFDPMPMLLLFDIGLLTFMLFSGLAQFSLFAVAAASAFLVMMVRGLFNGTIVF